MLDGAIYHVDVAPRTPQSKSQLLPPDTVPIPRTTSQSGYRTGDLTLGRAAVLKDLGRYLSIPYHIIVHSIFGPFTQDTLQIRQKLIDANVLTVATNNTPPRWTQFPVTPGKSDASESMIFAQFVGAVSKIFEQVSTCEVTCRAGPSETPFSDRGNTSRPDAYIAYKRPDSNERPASNKAHWWDIAIPFEFKKQNDQDSKKDNEEKIIWNLHNIMREDPRRRFALGITIEDKDMRIWCHSRAFLAASKPLDFMEAIDDVITLFSSIASKNEEQLGWDPTVERFRDREGKVQYRFRIGGELFTTTDELATYGADAMVGRGTRVYKAKDKDGTVVAIKDSWRNQDRDTEGAILAKIFDDIQNRLGKEEAEEAKKYFVRARISEDVFVSKKRDETPVFESQDTPAIDGEEGSLQWIDVDVGPVLSEKLHTPSTGHVVQSIHSPIVARHKVGSRDKKKLPMRVHTRTVFEDVGEPLEDVTCLADSFTCLSGALRALYYLHKAGWVHRDFSVTNVLWFEMDGIGKLTDFEYAKKFNSEATHDVRTGTMQFMAIEVESQCYNFPPNRYDPSRPDPPFRMNFLHDLESEWWVAIWILFWHTDAASPTVTAEAQLERAAQAFPPTIGWASRRDFFCLAIVLGRAFETLSPTYKQQYKPFMDHAAELREFYTKAEESYPDILLSDELLEDAHDKTSRIYSRIREALKDSNIRLQPLQVKRRLEGSPTNKVTKKAKLGNNFVD